MTHGSGSVPTFSAFSDSVYLGNAVCDVVFVCYCRSMISVLSESQRLCYHFWFIYPHIARNTNLFI